MEIYACAHVSMRIIEVGQKRSETQVNKEKRYKTEFLKICLALEVLINVPNWTLHDIKSEWEKQMTGPKTIEVSGNHGLE